MTALDQYSRLEATGLWHERPDAQRCEVLVSLGKATLIIATPAEVARAHWSLPAIVRLNPGKRPALYAPGEEAEERLEIEDRDMIAAIEKLRAAIDRRRPHPGRLRLWMGVSIAAAMLAAALFWMPGALIRQTVSVLPPAGREVIGQQLLQEIGRLAGPICSPVTGSGALTRLARRIAPEAPSRLAVLPSATPKTMALPGNIIVLNAALMEDHDTPEVVAGFILAETQRRTAQDPMLRLLKDAGLMATLRLLTTGQLDRAALQAHALTLLAQDTPAPTDPSLWPLFDAAGISARPYAAVAGQESRDSLPLAQTSNLRPVISDADWVSLQNICNS
ncbi:hypothetical protein LSUCC0031_10065 [Rhodobacterales bacterium LSUCC0031]|nr:hypothetical protein [Rhodobacterales bacterium LSUCC0031]